jgi:hypothetical protein
VGGIGGSGGYGEGPRLRVGSWTLEDSTLFSQVTGKQLDIQVVDASCLL